MKTTSCQAASQMRVTSIARGFTLVELLVVMAVIVLISLLVIPAVSSIEGGRRLYRSGSSIAGILEQARSFAMANNTYVWVGLKEEAVDIVSVGVVASRNGWANPVDTVVSSTNSELVQLDGVKRFENIKLVALPETLPHRSTDDKVAQVTGSTPPILPFTVGGGVNSKVFNNAVIQFNSRGECRISTQLFKSIEIGLQAAANSQVRNANDYVAVQVGGLSGSVVIYRP